MSLRLSTIFPHKAPLTEKNLPDQRDKVFIVTGGSGSIGEELISILYQHNARIYVAARSAAKTGQVINKVKNAHPKSSGELIFLRLILDDLTTIKQSANEFLAKESRLDVLWNNAGVMVPPQGSKTAQGYELQLGVNNLGHFLFTHFLSPVLVATASIAPKNSVRVIWVSSSGADAAPVPAIDFSNMNYDREEGPWTKYFRSKAGKVLYAAEFARKTSSDGIISIVRDNPPFKAQFWLLVDLLLIRLIKALNPGNFVTNLQQNMPKLQVAMFRLISHHPKYGAYTELFAGLSPTITEEHNGGWVTPFGKFEDVRKDLADPKLGKEYWEWSEEQVQPYF